MAIVTALAIKTNIAIVTALAIETDMAIVTILAIKTDMAIVTALAIKTDIHGYCDRTSHWNRYQMQETHFRVASKATSTLVLSTQRL